MTGAPMVLAISDNGDHYGCPGCGCTCHRPGRWR